MSNSVIPRSGCTLQWKIKNFSFCVQNIGEYIESETFAVANLETITPIEWIIRLYPRGDYEDEDYIACYIQRIDKVLDLITLDVTISLISADGSIHSLREFKGQSFWPEDNVGCVNLKRIEEIRGETTVFLPRDTLTIQCQLRVPTSSHKNFTIWSSVTHIQKLKFSRDCAIKSFSDWKVGDEKQLDVCPGVCMIALLNVSPSSNTQVPSERFIQFVIRDYDLNTKGGLYFTCKISVVDVNGVMGDFVKGYKYIFPNLTNRKCVLSQKVNYSKLIANSNLYLLNDELRLVCEMITSQNLPTISYTENLEIYTTGEVPKKVMLKVPNTLNEDLDTIHSKELFCDVTLQAKNGMLRAHKTILCARSFVFRNMLESDVTEGCSSIVELQDLDVATLKQMLMYMYTDRLDGLHKSDVSNLYYAASRYKIPGLIRECSSFLCSNLVAADVCEVLSLATTNKDDELMARVLDYIATHQEVIVSQKWKNFVQNKCSAETMQEILVRIAQQK